jgi:hypothetical protein
MAAAISAENRNASHQQRVKEIIQEKPWQKTMRLSF